MIMNVNFLVFDNFETLDLFGAVEVFGKVPDYVLNFYSSEGSLVRSNQTAAIDTQKIELITPGILVIPGGLGTRRLVNEAIFLGQLKKAASEALFVLTVCTGSALLAKTGLLDGHKATGNKMAWEWVISCGPKVVWQSKARWVVDGKYYTSSGVSAGLDMALGFVSDNIGLEKARDISEIIEYVWNPDPDDDPFARQ
jgi:transcriptional regulator GlxA family with amidase domain